MRTLVICLVILLGFGMVAQSLEKSNLPESVKEQNYNAKIEKQVALEKVNAASELQRQSTLKERLSIIDSLSEMEWLDIVKLPRNQLLTVINYYAARIFPFVFIGFIALSIANRFGRVKNSR